jgi:hypothetical protein
MTSTSNAIAADFLFELERSLGEARMFGVPLGAVLNDVIIIDLINGLGKWNAALGLRWLLGRWRLSLLGSFSPAMRPAAPSGHVLVTWRNSSSRFDEMLIPVIEELSARRCTVIFDKESVVPQIPAGAGQLQFFSALPREPSVWRPAFRRCWREWKTELKNACRRFGLPAAVYQRLALELVHSSQIFVGCRRFLQTFNPSAILTEYDRGVLWSCLTLAARSLNIPSFTLQHGVLGEQAVGYVPLVADKIFCWGETSREALVGAGARPEQILIGGCPRLDRELAASTAQARRKLGLDAAKQVVMLATAPYAETERARLVELFAGCMERFPDAAGIVRLHPSEKIAEYRRLAAAHVRLRFLENRDATLDESLAAADVVVVHNSGIGSDALVKRRPTIVVDLPPAPLGHGRDLIEQARCPCATTVDELHASVCGLLFDESVRRRHHDAAERFVDRFCASFGRDSARRIAAIIQETIATQKRIAG